MDTNKKQIVTLVVCGLIAAAVVMSLIGGLLFGALAQKSRMCFVGGLRDLFLVKDGKGLIVIGILLVGVLGYNVSSLGVKSKRDVTVVEDGDDYIITIK